jgi:magnesium transporter
MAHDQNPYPEGKKMPSRNRKIKVNRIMSLIREGKWKEVGALFGTLLPADKSEVYESLDVVEQLEFLPVADAGDVADIIEQIDDQDAARLAESLSPEMLIQVLSEMAPDEAANLLGDIDTGLRESTLAQLPEADRIRPLLVYPDDTAGGLKTLDFYVFHQETTAQEMLRTLKSQPRRDEEIPYIYAVDEYGKLTGVIRLADLLRAHPQAALRTITKAQIVSIAADEDQELAARLLNRYDLMALPVVDHQNRILGVITADDAMAVLEEETTEDFYKRSGILSAKIKQMPKSDLLLRGPLWMVWAVRLPFLLITVAGGILAGVVIEMFSDLLETVVVLALFIPVIMDMGGNAGLQSTSIFIRGYVLGHIDTHQIGKHILREMAIGLGMGVLLGLIVGAFAVVWQGEPMIGLVVGLSLMVTIIIATLLGFLIPFSLTKLGIDPAAGSGPLITTIKDITGLFIYFGMASLLLGQLL